MIRKAALSLVVIGASGAYVWTQSVTPSRDDLADATPATAAALVDPKAAAPIAAQPLLIVREPANTGDDAATTGFRPAAPVRVQSVAIDPGQAMPSAQADQEATAPAVSPAQGDAAPARPRPTLPKPAALTTVALPRLRPGLDTAVGPIKASAKLAMKPHGGLADGTFDGPAVDAFYGLVQIEANVQSGRLVAVNILQYPSDRRTSVAINRQALPILKREAITAQSANIDIVSGATLTSEAFIQSLGAALRQANT